ncbi:MAG: histidinol-phosphate transaminase [Candidatus Omnitrophica bacterium]|nr:histidinol-phosphate transaminase [Candidatus Omnitrophota bacterium]
MNYKSYIQGITPYEPGKPIEEVQRELGLKRVIKLASNENPLGPSKKVRAAIAKFSRNIHLYPDGGVYRLKMKLSERLQVAPDQLIFGNGSNEIIELLVKGFVEEGDKVLSSEKSFLVYPLVTRTLGGNFSGSPMKDYRYNLEALASLVDDRTRLIFIANPNNPTGTYVSRNELDDFLDRIPERVIVCLDEAYIDFVDAPDFPDGLFYVKLERKNVIVLRTFSKSHGLAGLRVGFGAGPRELIAYLHKIRQPFNVNSLAQQAALAALDDAEYSARTRRVVLEGRRFLAEKFAQLRLNFVSSQGNFILVDAERDAEQVFRFLLKKGIIIRSMKPYGLPTHIRVSIGLAAENRAFVRELGKMMKKIRKGGDLPL